MTKHLQAFAKAQPDAPRGGLAALAHAVVSTPDDSITQEMRSDAAATASRVDASELPARALVAGSVVPVSEMKPGMRLAGLGLPPELRCRSRDPWGTRDRDDSFSGMLFQVVSVNAPLVIMMVIGKRHDGKPIGNVCVNMELGYRFMLPTDDFAAAITAMQEGGAA